MGSLFGGSKQKIGYKYHIGMHLVLCYGPCDAVRVIRVGEREAWSGVAVDGDEIQVNAPELFGGEKREGGVVGNIDVEMGSATQSPNSNLQSVIQNNIPAFRGVVSMVFKNFYYGNNPYLKNIATLIKRTDIQTNGNAQWQQALANISNGMNPAHIIRECLTNDSWGMGYGEGLMDETSFLSAATTLFNEGFGLNMLWSNAEPIDQFIQNVETHINAAVSQDPVTSLWKLKLIREDYTLGSLPSFDENNVSSLDSFQRRAWGETVNEISVVYRDNSDADGQKDKTVTVQDISNVQVQGVRIGRTVNLQGIAQEDLAARVALRELRIAASPLATITITVNRDAINLIIGDAFKFSWADLGIVNGVYRIANIDYGSVRDHKIRIEAIEDVFSLESATYLTSQPSGWTDPRSAPAAATNQQAVEATYWEIIQNVSQADIDSFDPDAGFSLAHAARPTSDSYDFDLWTRVGAADYVLQRPGDFCPYATLEIAVDKNATVLDYENDIDVDTVPTGIYTYLNTEIIEIVSIDLVNKQVTVNRGILDTTPKDHAIGAQFWFVGNFGVGIDLTERVAGQTVDLKILPSTGQGTLDIASATAVQVTMDNRFQRPYPPGGLTINSVLFEDLATDQQVYAWRHRDRTQQTVDFVTQTAADIGPEAGVTYTLELYDENGVLRRTETGLTGTTYTWTLGDEKNDCQIDEPEAGASDSYESLVNGDTPTVYLRLGESSGTTLFDETANNHDVTISGTHTLGVAGAITGDPDTAITFGGATGMLAAHADFNPSSGDYSAEAWVRYTTTSKGAFMAVRDNTDVYVSFQVDSGKIRCRGWRTVFVASATNFNDGDWHHAVMTYTASDNMIHLYVDGALEGSLDQLTTIPSANGKFWVAYEESVNVYNGDTDEIVWINHKALSLSEIQQRYNKGIGNASGFRVNDQIRVALKSVNSTPLDSFQSQDHTYQRTGWGLRWDQNWDDAA